MPKFDIDYYHDYISESLADYLLQQSTAVNDVNGLREVGRSGGLENAESLNFLCALYERITGHLKKVLEQRIQDRRFIDARVKACYEFNKNLRHDFTSVEYQSVIGLEDAKGRIVIGPKNKDYCNEVKNKPIAPIPEYLKGPHVTLFGPPGTAKMAINAMNTFHRQLKDEPPVVAKLLQSSVSNPMWGADDEDSKTPLRADLIDSGINLQKCFEKNISFAEPEAGRNYELAADRLALPIKRFPGLALPCTFLFYKNNPLPLHLYDFALHLFHCWNKPEALVFYVPKLENEEEALYIHDMITTAESMIQELHPDYVLGSVRLMVVLENPRAILRTHEIIDALHPYFVGASLGWHDYLGSTARLFKEDANYRIPVKADPDIVIKYIKASHQLLAEVVGSRGGIKVGGMYGILPLDNNKNSDSFQITMKGYIKDVVTQMKRNLTGFWVAHPDFVRLGIALVEAWKQHTNGNSSSLFLLIEQLLEKKHHQDIFDFIKKPDSGGLDKTDPQYVRALIVADIKESDFIANNHPDEIRYNVFQILQYLTDWLRGNGCVALPAHVHGTAVRVMDDLATAERSRWEVWHELHHGRFSLDQFLQIAFEELAFIRKDLSTDEKIVQVKWTPETAKWYPIAFRLMLQLMTSESPSEFATELLLPFTDESVRQNSDPLKLLQKIDPNKYKLNAYIERFIYYFEICGVTTFASQLAADSVFNITRAEKLIMNFSKDEILQAASFHGDIGDNKKNLDHLAAQEQRLVFDEDEKTLSDLKNLGSVYLQKFGMKFLVSAKGKSGSELLTLLKLRIENNLETEIQNAREALRLISIKRFNENPLDTLLKKIEELQIKYTVKEISLSITENHHIQYFGKGEFFQLASLSKTLASAFACEYFKSRNISLDTSVNKLLAKTKSTFHLKDDAHAEWGDRVTLRHLMSHSALSMHYVNGISLNENMPNSLSLLSKSNTYNYEDVKILDEPGKSFHYSGGGFLVLEHLIEALENKPIQQLTEKFLQDLSPIGSLDLSFSQKNLPGIRYACGYFDDRKAVENGRLMFPAFAAGAMGNAQGMAQFLNRLTSAFQHLEGASPLSHDTAVEMIFASDKGCREFMGCDMGLGIFVAQCGDNKLVLHQGANEGFRALYLHCVAGPDCGKGFVILCNADAKGVLFISEAAQEILKHLKISGVDETQFKTNFDSAAIKKEQLVNLGYKNLIFNAFTPTLPEEILIKGPHDELSRYNLLIGAKITKVSNQNFARAVNMLSDFLPTFDPELFGKQGKIMDSWESSRHNPYDFDFIELEIFEAKNVNFARLSTKYHDGNQAEYVRILGYSEQQKIWIDVLPKTKMLGHSYIDINLQKSENKSSLIVEKVKRFKIEMYPDGGLSRVGLYENLPNNMQEHFLPVDKAVCKRFHEVIPKTLKPLSLKYEINSEKISRNKRVFSENQTAINLAGLAFGAEMIKTTNEHYGPAIQVISPFPPIHMFDGLESARSRNKGHFEEVVIKLAQVSTIQRIIFDFKYFVNNNPREIGVWGLTENDSWQIVVETTNVKAFAANKKEFKVSRAEKFKQLKLQIFPDGGINRLEVY